VRAAIEVPAGKLLRANYSANADIILERRDQVLTVNEKLLQFDHKQPFVEVRTGPGQFERREVKLGLSDGARAEVLEGVTLDSDIKVPHSDTEEPPASPGH
jgi:HlyD family secretion protein